MNPRFLLITERGQLTLRQICAIGIEIDGFRLEPDLFHVLRAAVRADSETIMRTLAKESYRATGHVPPWRIKPEEWDLWLALHTWLRAQAEAGTLFPPQKEDPAPLTASAA